MEGEAKTTGLDPAQEAEFNQIEAEIGAVDLPPDQQVAANDDGPKQHVGVMLVAVCGSMLAGARGRHWQPSPEESEAIGSALDAVLDKYLPNFETGPEFALISAVAIYTVPRLMKDRELLAKSDRSGRVPEEVRSREAANDGD